MSRELIGFLVVAVALVTLVSKFRRPPDKGDYKPAEVAFPRLHLYKGSDDAQASVDVFDRTGQPLGRMVLDDGRVYDPKDASLRALVTPDLYLVDSSHWDLGTFAAYRGASRGTDTDELSAGVRLSPVRILYGTIAPDLVIAQDWGGGGISAYLPERLVGTTASHFGIGAWYGYPFQGADRGGPAGWAYGLTFSTR